MFFDGTGSYPSRLRMWQTIKRNFLWSILSLPLTLSPGMEHNSRSLICPEALANGNPHQH